MVYLGIAFVVLLIVAPIIALLPSARQKEQMALRKAARERGLRTELTTIEDPDPDPGKYRSVTGKELPRELKCIAYRRPRPRPAGWRWLPAMEWAVVRGEPADGALPDGWRWDVPLPPAASDELRSTLVSTLESLPDDVVKVDESHYIVSVYWLERGGMEAGEQVARALETLTATEAHAPRPAEDSDAVDDDPS